MEFPPPQTAGFFRCRLCGPRWLDFAHKPARRIHELSEENLAKPPLLLVPLGKRNHAARDVGIPACGAGCVASIYLILTLFVARGGAVIAYHKVKVENHPKAAKELRVKHNHHQP